MKKTKITSLSAVIVIICAILLLVFGGCKLAVKQLLAGVNELGLQKSFTIIKQRNCLWSQRDYIYVCLCVCACMYVQGLGEYNTDTEAFTALRTQVAMLLEAAANK